jgi:hypothetical protein
VPCVCVCTLCVYYSSSSYTCILIFLFFAKLVKQQQQYMTCGYTCGTPVPYSTSIFYIYYIYDYCTRAHILHRTTTFTFTTFTFSAIPIPHSFTTIDSCFSKRGTSLVTTMFDWYWMRGIEAVQLRSRFQRCP